MSDLLIVASPTSSPLSTPGPFPFEQLPGFWDYNSYEGDGASPADDLLPATVARWTEVEQQACPRWVWDDGTYKTRCMRVGVANVCPQHGPYEARKVGAIVELVEVTGPSHHADGCERHGRPGSEGTYRIDYCTSDALPDCWHTPTGKVTRLPAPIPCDRPEEPRGNAPGGGPVGWHRPSRWWADEETAAQLHEATADVG